MIPKLLHFIWMQGFDAMPERYARCVETWKDLHPDWDVMEWAADNLPQMNNAWILDKTDDPTFISEIVRYEVVLKYGGVYVDADMECIQPIDPLLKYLQAFVSMRNSTYLETCGFGATPDHPWVRAVVEMTGQLRGRIQKVLDVQTPLEHATRGRDDVRVFPVSMFHFTRGEVENYSSYDATYSIHHRYGMRG